LFMQHVNNSPRPVRGRWFGEAAGLAPPIEAVGVMLTSPARLVLS